MTLLKFICQTCRRLIIVTTITALLSGACNAGLIAMVNAALTRSSRFAPVVMWAFIALGLGKILTHFASQVLLARFSQGAIAELRRDLSRKILAVPLRNLEEIGAPRLLAALTEDVFHITQALLAIPVVSVNLAILLGGAVYLGWLSWQILAALATVIVVGAAGYRLLVASAFSRMSQARQEEDKLYGHFRALTEGIKELKLHRERRGAFFTQNIQTTTERYQQLNIAAEVRFTAAQSWSHLLYFALIGLILFLAPTLMTVSQHALTGYVITTLYLMGPLAGVLSSLSMFGRASVALQNVQKLGLTLSHLASEECSLASSGKGAGFQRLELLNVRHTYHREQEDTSFVLGPINLAFHPGELVFLVGGNGSGKSTLAKLLAGLYLPESGELRLDGHPISDLNRDNYRQLFSAVFADFYLFDNLLGLESPNLDRRAANYLEQLHLSHKVSVKNGVFSTVSVSQGQRKRLALLTAYLEDRPFYLFDEWAADQDPLFKEVFYTQLLPELKGRGKTVLVITHDDNYFHLADRLIKLESGKLVALEKTNGLAFAPLERLCPNAPVDTAKAAPNPIF